MLRGDSQHLSSCLFSYYHSKNTFNMTTPIDGLPDTFEDRFDVLKGILRMGLQKLILEAKRKNVITQPYGRHTEPTPLITKDEFLQTKDDPDDEPKFNFQYGFNPFTFLASYIKWAHPSSSIEREKDRQDAVTRLKKRANHARLQIATVNALRSLSFKYSKSGIIYGPVSSPLSSTSVLLLCRAVRPGDVVFEVAKSEVGFPIGHNIVTYLQAEGKGPIRELDKSNSESDSTSIMTIEVTVENCSVPARAIFSNLNPGTFYCVSFFNYYYYCNYCCCYY